MCPSSPTGDFGATVLNAACASGRPAMLEQLLVATVKHDGLWGGRKSAAHSSVERELNVEIVCL
jgi:hypothetical protein